MPAIMMADPGRQGPGPGDHQREAEHLRRMQVCFGEFEVRILIKEEYVDIQVASLDDEDC